MTKMIKLGTRLNTVKSNTAYVRTKYTPKQFIKHVLDGSHYTAYCANDYRRLANFKSCSLLSIDIDQGMAVAEANSLDIVKHHALFLYTTKSYTKENPRFRLVFVLENPITNVKDFRALYYGITSKHFPTADMCGASVVQQWYGAPKSRKYKVFGLSNVLPQDLIDKYIKLGRALLAAEQVNEVSRTSKLKLATLPEWETTDNFKDMVLNLLEQYGECSRNDWLCITWSLMSDTKKRFTENDLIKVTEWLQPSKVSNDVKRYVSGDFRRVLKSSKTATVGLGFVVSKLKQRFGADCLRAAYSVIPSTTHSLDYLDGLPGTGKTYSMCEKIIKAYEKTNLGYHMKRKWLIVVPTIVLANEYKSILEKALGPSNVVALHSDSKAVQSLPVVKPFIKRHLEVKTSVIIITQASFKSLDAELQPHLASYNLVLDEVINPVISTKSFSLHQSLDEKKSKLLQVMDMKPIESRPGVFALSIKDQVKYKAYKKYKDTYYSVSNKPTLSLLAEVANPLIDSYCARMNKRVKHDDYTFTSFVSAELFKKFKTVTVLAAGFTDTLLAHHLQLNGFALNDATYKFKGYKDRQERMKDRFKRLHLTYLTEEQYSKTYRDNTRWCQTEHLEAAMNYARANDGRFDRGLTQTCLQHAMRIVEAPSDFKGKKLIVLNNDAKREAKWLGIRKSKGFKMFSGEASDAGSASDFVIIPADCRGLNDYQDYTNLIVIASFKPTPQHRAFLEKVFPKYSVTHEWETLLTLQQICRTAIRKEGNKQDIWVMLPSISDCNAVHALLDGRPHIHNTQFEGFTSYTVSNGGRSIYSCEERLAKKAQLQAEKLKCASDLELTKRKQAEELFNVVSEEAKRFTLTELAKVKQVQELEEHRTEKARKKAQRLAQLKAEAEAKLAEKARKKAQRLAQLKAETEAKLAEKARKKAQRLAQLKAETEARKARKALIHSPEYQAEKKRLNLERAKARYYEKVKPARELAKQLRKAKR